MTGANRAVNFGLADFDYQISDSLFTMIITNPFVSTTGLWINITYNSGNYFLSGIKLSYLTVDPTFTEPFSISSFSKVFLFNLFSGSLIVQSRVLLV